MPDDALTCLSCGHWRRHGCEKKMPHWPNERLAWCVMAQYEPGSDECELKREEEMKDGRRDPQY